MSIKPQTQLYFIALLPEPEIERELYQFKIDLFEKYGYKVSLKSPAHITLIPPFSWSIQQAEEIRKIFLQYSVQSSSFDINIQGFDTFGDKVFYAKPICPQEIFDLQKDIFQYFKPYLSEKLQNQFHFRPHITIANRDIVSNELPQIIAEFNAKSYYRQTKVSEITMFRHDGSKWVIESQLPLKSRR
ncbi:MAG: 2'-5' RNA ligase family protein [Chitinophagales bacterium]|nr:2'-5' RNA ligase family protein [Chitinophagales bacterium]